MSRVPPTDPKLASVTEARVSFLKFTEHAPTPQNLKLFQQFRPPEPQNAVLGFVLTLPPLGEPSQSFVGGWLGASMCLGGSCTEASTSTVLVLDPLRIASLCGKPDIVETLLFHKKHSPEREAECCELLGAARVFCTQTMDWFCNEPWSAQACWLKAFDLHARLGDLSKKDDNWRSRLMCLRDVKPASKPEDLSDLGNEQHSMFIQAFLVLERVLGLPWRIEEPVQGEEFIATRLLPQMVKGICEMSSNTANALELLGYLILYVPNRAALTSLFNAIDNECNAVVAGPNILTLMQDCKDLSIRQVANYIHFMFSRHPTKEGYSYCRCLSLICGKIDLEMLSEKNISQNDVTPDDLNGLLHAIATVWKISSLKENGHLEALASRLLELDASTTDPRWFQSQSTDQIATGHLADIVKRAKAEPKCI